jgi:hypothetical protein
MKILKLLSIWLAITAVTVVSAVVLFEFGMQKLHRTRTVVMVVSDKTYGDFDERTGIRWAPNTALSLAYLDASGRVMECFKNASVTNKDGFKGVDTLDDYNKAKIKIILSGDSYSNWSINGETNADYTKTELNSRGVDAAILNVAGGGYGLQHMVAHVAATLDRLKESPKIIVIQFIKDDITRGWWYFRVERDDHGWVRSRMAPSIECLSVNSACGADTGFVHPGVTEEWCESQKNNDSENPISDELVSRYRAIRGYFVFTRRALKALGADTTSTIPRIKSLDDLNERQINPEIETIASSGAHVVFVYLPTRPEIASQKYELNALQKSILDFYTRKLNAVTVFPTTYSAFDGVTDFFISPVDTHPSGELQKAYGRYVASILLPLAKE